MKKLRMSIFILAIVLVVFLSNFLYFTPAYWQTFGQTYGPEYILYDHGIGCYAVSDVTSHYLTPGGSVLRYGDRKNIVFPALKAVCSIELTALNFDILFKDGVWRNSDGYGDSDAFWLRDNCEAAWLGVSFPEGKVQAHYVLKLKDGDIVVCDSYPVSWDKLDESYFYRANSYSPRGNVFEFYENAVQTYFEYRQK